MLIARGELAGRDLLVLGVTGDNVRLLLDGHPIRITPETHEGAPPGMAIVIAYGRTTDVIQAELEAAGLVTPETVIYR